MIYLDANALVKLIRQEDESSALMTWLGDHEGESLVSSVLVEVEVPRALRRNQPKALAAVAAALTKISRFDIDNAVRATAGAYTDANLRSLDAIHLATADQLIAAGKVLTAFVTYDKRLAAVATEAGLTVVSPGVA